MQLHAVPCLSNCFGSEALVDLQSAKSQPIGIDNSQQGLAEKPVLPTATQRSCAVPIRRRAAQ
jgi:hypothetical protein